LEGFDSYALNIECTPHPATGTVDVQARFDEAVISKPQVERLLSQFELVFQQMSSSSTNSGGLLVGDVQVASSEELDQFKSWNRQQPVPPAATDGALVHDKIRTWAADQPDATAI